MTPKDQWLSKLSGSWIKGVVGVSGVLVMTSLVSLYYVKQSEISERRGDLERAFENADFAKLLSPRFFDTNYRYSNLHFRRQNPSDSSKTIVQLTHDYPYTAMVLKLAADFEFAHKNYFDSQYYAREALRVDPTLESAKELLKSFEKTQELSK
ncbi:MAG: hypothetical protein IPJ69_09940 [Deltaproteobacteria bacterium]|nr:MAG: hypothetical protein IPJ69_09940 [Deltaproteobacteria bacterium]